MLLSSTSISSCLQGASWLVSYLCFGRLALEILLHYPLLSDYTTRIHCSVGRVCIKYPAAVGVMAHGGSGYGFAVFVSRHAPGVPRALLLEYVGPGDVALLAWLPI